MRLMKSEGVDRYVIAAWMLRFWWIVAALGVVAALWLFRSIARSGA